jgi:hypothetical protein
MKKFLGEFLTIVLGVLIALAVDGWRQDREELRIASEHLSDVAAELRQNLCTVERIRALQMPRKIENLQTVLQFLNDPQADVADPVALLYAFARSTAAAQPWLVDNQYQALQNSGNVRLVRKLQPELGLSSLYEAPDVLLSQVQRIQGPYPVVVNELIPAQLQSEFSQLRGYARGEQAPALVDDADLARAIEAIRARRLELLALARNEAAVTTGRWYALARISNDLHDTVQELARWDRDTTPLEEFLVECRTRSRATPPAPTTSPAPDIPQR